MSQRFMSRVRERLQALEATHLLRTLHAPMGVDLSSNDYLGLATHPLLKERLAEAVAREGVGSTGSRLLRGEREAFAAIERRFATFKGTDRALYFSSGYLANLAVLTTFPEAGDVILSDERNHASLVDGVRLSSAKRVIFPHNDVAALGDLLAQMRGSGQVFVVVESLFSMDGDMAPLRAYATICRRAGALLIVDEAHAVGIYGQRGSGLIEALTVTNDVFVSINTAGKALGVGGAFVTGPADAIDYLIQRARSFVFSTAPPPCLAAALDASLTLVEQEPIRRADLLARTHRARTKLTEVGVEVPQGSSQIIPVLLGDDGRALAVAHDLQAQGFDVRAIRPPSVAVGTARLRISINVSLTDAVIDRFVAALAAAVSLAAPCSADSL